MWVSESWKDYELLDASGGERLERWGDYILVRPDPQVIWDTPKTHPGWRSRHARYERSRDGGGHWQKNNTLPEYWHIRYGSLRLKTAPMSFKHTGVFPEQASNWDFIAKQVGKAAKPLKILNLFAYTGGATLAALAAGAELCHVDAAKGMVAWARENAALSGLDSKPVRWIVDDCAEFVKREIKRGRRYDALIMDPPSYGRGPGGQIWKLEDNLFEFLKLCKGVLAPEPAFVLISSYTAGLAPGVLSYLLNTVFGDSFAGTAVAEELGLPVKGSGMILPCGSSGRLC